MATQGVVSVVVGDKTVVKAVAGSDGYNANLLVEEIRRGHLVTPEDVLNAAKRVGFGHESDLVVQGPDENLFEGDEDLAGLYLDRSKFLDPRFNPRWNHGTADHVEVVEFPA
jgi:hypothetical protein